MNIDLTGKLALVKGGIGELGKVMVRTLVECGADVAIHYNSNIEQANKLLKEVLDRGKKAIIVQVDVTNYESVIKMRDYVINNIGRPDITVDTAVIQYDWKTVLEQGVEDYEGQFKSCVMKNVLRLKPLCHI